MMLPQKTLRALAETDAMPPDLRACVHEYGYPIVYACLSNGVNNPASIRHLVCEIWRGARNTDQRNKKSIGRATITLDWVLIQAGAEISAERLIRVLDDHSMVIVPKEPTPAMVEASMRAIQGMGLMNKPRKHLLRLRAAIKAGAHQFWSKEKAA